MHSHIHAHTYSVRENQPILDQSYYASYIYASRVYFSPVYYTNNITRRTAQLCLSILVKFIESIHEFFCCWVYQTVLLCKSILTGSIQSLASQVFLLCIFSSLASRFYYTRFYLDNCFTSIFVMRVLQSHFTSLFQSSIERITYQFYL